MAGRCQRTPGAGAGAGVPAPSFECAASWRARVTSSTGRPACSAGTAPRGSSRAAARVRALVRPSSARSFLRGLGVELATGDLHDPASLRAAAAGADVVYHCAARVGDWGPWALYERQVVAATRNVLDACRAAGAG